MNLSIWAQTLFMFPAQAILPDAPATTSAVAESKFGELVPFNGWELAFIAIYLSSLVLIGAISFLKRKENTLKDFYLAGPGIGFIVLLLTLYATQYSGNTLFGFTGRAYKDGFSWLICVHFMTAIVVFYLLLAPKLYRLSRENNFITPADFIQYRFKNKAFTLFTSVIVILAIANYLLAQLTAMGRALQGMTSYDPDTAFVVGVVFLALVIVVYESLGGFRAVAWTDVIQGSVLMIGFFVLVFAIFNQYGSLDVATRKLMTNPEASAQSKVLAPAFGKSTEWFSYILIVGIGGALYPQSIQRIYAAKSAGTLRKSLAVMAFLPLTTTLIVVIVGVIGFANEANIAHSDTILTVMCRRVQESSTFGRILILVLFSGILAALMSTADSVLLSISSMFTKDIVGNLSPKPLSESALTKIGKVFSWVMIFLTVLVSIQLYKSGTTLVSLLDRKFDLLCQLGPAFFLGIRFRWIKTNAAFSGMVLGVVIAITLAEVYDAKPMNIHAGLYGLVVNLIVTVGGSIFPARKSSQNLSPSQT